MAIIFAGWCPFSRHGRFDSSQSNGFSAPSGFFLLPLEVLNDPPFRAGEFRRLDQDFLRPAKLEKGLQSVSFSSSSALQ